MNLKDATLVTSLMRDKKYYETEIEKIKYLRDHHFPCALTLSYNPDSCISSTYKKEIDIPSEIRLKVMKEMEDEFKRNLNKIEKELKDI